jgi:fatty acid desaturase
MWVLRDSPLVVFVGLLLGLTSAQTVLLGHDVAHGAAFVGRGRVTGALGRALPHLLIGLLSGGSAAWWKQSHNTHHALSNDPEFDPDAYYPFLAFEPAQVAERVGSFPFFLPRQHLLVWLVMPFVAVTVRLYSVAFLVRRIVQGRGSRGRHLLALATALAFFAAYLTFVFKLLPVGRGIALVVVHQALFGYYLGLITATNHWGMPMPDAARQSFFVHQVTTSRNIRGGPLVRFLYGGLDRQVEHHLFATLPRPRLYEAAVHVQAVCRERGIPYVERTPGEALGDVYGCLQRIAHGLRPGPGRHA